MTNPMDALREVVVELKARSFAIAIADFTFAGREYVVLIKRYLDKKPEAEKYALARLEFILRADTSVSEEWPANRAGLMGDPTGIRKFFGIPFQNRGVRDALQYLYEQLGAAISRHTRYEPREDELHLLIAKLSIADSSDPKRLYCFAARRNETNKATGRPHQRSEYNSQKTAILRPELFARLKGDTSISFMYSLERERCREDEQIYNSLIGK